jgi:hypothetical protein
VDRMSQAPSDAYSSVVFTGRLLRCPLAARQRLDLVKVTAALSCEDRPLSLREAFLHTPPRARVELRNNEGPLSLLDGEAKANRHPQI